MLQCSSNILIKTPTRFSNNNNKQTRPTHKHTNSGVKWLSITAYARLRQNYKYCIKISYRFVIKEISVLSGFNQFSLSTICCGGLPKRGVNHFLEISGIKEIRNFLRLPKPEISYAKCWSDIPLVPKYLFTKSKNHVYSSGCIIMVALKLFLLVTYVVVECSYATKVPKPHDFPMAASFKANLITTDKSKVRLSSCSRVSSTVPP